MNKTYQATMEEVANLAKRRGFLYAGSDIYGGLAGTYDYGPLGVRLKENVMTQWRQSMLFDHENIVEVDAAIMMHPKVWHASGHVGGFSDPLVEHKKTNKRFRVDHLLEAIGVEADEKMSDSEIQALFDENFEKLDLPSKDPSEFTPVRSFNLLVQSNFGATTAIPEDPVYLRGETCLLYTSDAADD